MSTPTDSDDPILDMLGQLSEDLTSFKRDVNGRFDRLVISVNLIQKHVRSLGLRTTILEESSSSGLEEVIAGLTPIPTEVDEELAPAGRR